MIKNTKTSLLMAFPAMLASILMIVIGVYAYTAFNKMDATTKQLVNNSEVADVFSHTRKEFFQLRLGTLKHNEKEIQKRKRVISKTLSELNSLDISFLDDKQSIIPNLMPDIDRYIAMYREEERLAQSTNTIGEVTAERKLFGKQISGRITQLVLAVNNHSHHLGSQTTDTIHQVKINIITLIIIATLLSVMTALWMSKRLLHIINRVKCVMEKLARGELTEQTNIDGSNELYALAADIDKVIVYMRRMMSDISNATAQMASQISQLNNQSNANSRALEAHTVETDQVAAAMSQMNAATHNVARDANTSAQYTQRANEQAQRSRESVEQATNTVAALVREVDSAAATIAHINQDTQQIASILGVIGDIAEQTNLLALNAAIEAARAGEQGRGFAVVADEVRALAGRTQACTSEIDTMLSQLRRGADSAVSAMENTRQSCQEAAKTTSIVTETLAELNNSVFDINGLSNQIAAAVDEQSAVSEEVNCNLARIREMVNEFSDSSQITLASTCSLAETREQLSSMVSHFKL